MRRLRLGCVGTGFIAGKHLAALSSFEDVDVVAVADNVEERAAAAAAAHDARCYTDGVDLVESEDLDAVWFCVPPFAHGHLEEAAVRHELPFFVEKPLAHDLITAERIAGLVKSAGLLTAVGYHWRYLDLVKKVQAFVQDRPPLLLTGHWLDSTPPVPWWVRRGQSGGQLVEQTTHVLDLARLLVGEVTDLRSVHVQATGVDGGQDGEELVPLASAISLRFDSGAVGSVSSARVLPARHRVGLQLVGEGYALDLTERAIVDHELAITTATGTVSERCAQDPIAAEDRAFLDAVAGRGDDVRSSYAEALRTHSLACAAERPSENAEPNGA
ncbi:Gfo/Idh/MocA family protein [Aeromicrobium wangtongii]|uniref:Gfo/Idh/MocA family protein n=1 Tax=Aeromicrobium wangtongii TaxID=2969247 RepID=UPI0020174E98|nr:Gfo/Idh/MocA family oxidoreductase [Aeromicrobium wangtongii]MCL3819369.1 Gfo/Idh/MocA family oxidoreductase [Aeromicrobium wangtongii]